MIAATLLGLLSKPMVVSLPLAMLLLDFWPLGRLSLPARGAGVREGARELGRALRPRLVEKLPALRARLRRRRRRPDQPAARWRDGGDRGAAAAVRVGNAGLS